MPRSTLLLVFALLCSACGADAPASPAAAPAPTPTPTPAPTANVVSLTGAAWVSCLPAIGGFAGSCQLQGQIKNTGAGCAGTVRGTTVFLNGSQTIGSPAAWSVNASVVMRSGETLVYLTTSEPLSVVNVGPGYITTPSWSNVPCQ